MKNFRNRWLIEVAVYLAWCLPSGIIFLGFKGMLFLGLLSLAGRPLSVLLKRQCFLLERITFALALSIVLFGFLLSWLLHVMPLRPAFAAASCLYAGSSLLIAIYNHRHRITAADTTGSKSIYGILLAFNLFLCLAASNVQVGWEQAHDGEALSAIINHDPSYGIHKYSSILYDALIYSFLQTQMTEETPSGAMTAIVPPYHARAVTLLAIQLYVMTAASMLSLFVPQTFAVMLAPLTYYFFSASAGWYTFFILHQPLGQFSNNYALVQFSNLFFAMFLPMYGLWHGSKSAIAVGCISLAFLPASHPGYFIIVAPPLLMFPAFHAMNRRHSARGLSTTSWKIYYQTYFLSYGIACLMIMIHRSFLRDFLFWMLKLPMRSEAFLKWGNIFLDEPRWRITVSHFATTYRMPINLPPLWSPENLQAFPPWIFLMILLFPYLYKYHKHFCFMAASIYGMSGLYLLRGIPLNDPRNLVDVYQPFHVLLHVSMLLASYCLLEFIFYNKNPQTAFLSKAAVGILLFLTYVITGINTFWATIYPGVLGSGSQSYIVSLFHHDIAGTISNSFSLYRLAVQALGQGW